MNNILLLLLLLLLLFNNNYSLRWRWMSVAICRGEFLYPTQVEKNSTKTYFICDNKLKNDWFLELRTLLDAWRWIYLYIHLQVSQSARAKSTIHLCGVY